MVIWLRRKSQLRLCAKSFKLFIMSSFKRLSFSDFMESLLRHKAVVFGAVFSALCLASIILNFVPPRYQANASIQISSNADIASEVEVIKGRRFIDGLVTDLGLMADPDFNSRFAGQAPSDDQFKSLSLYQGEFERLSLRTRLKDMKDVIARVRDSMSAQRVDETNVMRIDFRSSSAEKAAFIVNQIAQRYVASNQILVEIAPEAREDESALLEQRVTLLQQRDEAQSDLERFLATAPSDDVDPEESVSKDLTKAREEYQDIQQRVKARVDQLRALQKNGRIFKAREVQASSLIKRLQRQKRDAQAKLSSLSERYGSKHPQIISQKNAIANAQRRIASEIEQIILDVEHGADIARARVANMERVAQNMQRQSDAKDKARVAFEKEASEKREALARLSQRLLDLDGQLEVIRAQNLSQQEVKAGSAIIISEAVIPDAPYFPNKPLILLIVCFASFLIAAVVCAVRCTFDDKIYTQDHLDAVCDLPCLGDVPAKASVVSAVYDAALKDVYQRIMLRPASSKIAEGSESREIVQKQGEVIGFVSSYDEADMAGFAVDMARGVANSGSKIIVVDTDFYHPRLHEAVGADNDITLVDFLTGERKADEVMKTDDPSGVHFMYARNVPSSASDLLHKQGLKRFIAALRYVYDVVFVIAPSDEVRADAAVLTQFSDRIVYVARRGSTKRGDVSAALKLFASCDYDAMSTVLIGTARKP